MGSVQSVVRYRDIGWPTTTVDARADVARTPNNRSLLLLAFKLFQGLRDLSPASARRRLQPARGPVLGVTGVQLVPMIYLRWGRSAGLLAAAGLAAAALLTTHGRNLVVLRKEWALCPGVVKVTEASFSETQYCSRETYIPHAVH